MVVTFDGKPAVRSGEVKRTDDQCNQLYDAGCDDGPISTSQGVTRVDFAREATNLEAAIRSAIANVTAAGLDVERVEIEVRQLRREAM